MPAASQLRARPRAALLAVASRGMWSSAIFFAAGGVPAAPCQPAPATPPPARRACGGRDRLIPRETKTAFETTFRGGLLKEPTWW